MEHRVRQALESVRELAHGLFPSVLSDEGLAAALEELVAGSDVPTDLQVGEVGDVGVDEAMAAYATVAAALDEVGRAAPWAPASVSAVRRQGTLEVRVEMRAPNGTRLDFTEVSDRVGAVGGRFSLSEQNGGTLVARALIPCGS
jgi:signal transduction histidine kinase